jgi:hypothetical protein
MGFIKSLLFGLIAGLGILALFNSINHPTPLLSPLTKPGVSPVARKTASDLKHGKKFDPQNRFIVMDHARTLIKELGPKFGIKEYPKTENYQIKTGKFSAQIFAKQDFQGVPVNPGGSLTLDLGPNGEVISFNSSFYQDLEATNHPDGNEKVIQEKVLEFAKASFEPSKLEGGSLSFRVEGQKKGRFIREYSYAGQKIIVDAHDGNPIRIKDSRVQ